MASFGSPLSFLRSLVEHYACTELTDSDRKWLRQVESTPTFVARVRMRARVVLLLSTGLPDRAVARELGISRQTVAMWRGRVAEAGARAILVDAPGRGRPPAISAATREAVRRSFVASCRRGKPLSVRQLALSFGVSSTTAHRLVQPLAPLPKR